MVAHPRPLAPVGDPDAAGVPRDVPRRALDVDADVLAQATDDAWLVERAGGTVRVVESTARELQGHDAARPRARRARAGRLLVLTDYHVHLRPDDEGHRRRATSPRANAERYREAAEERGIAELGVAEHIHRFRRRSRSGAPVVAQVGARRRRRLLRVRARGDRPAPRHRGRLRRGPRGADRAFLEAREWDYVVGSVHFVRDAAVDLEGPEWEHVWGRGDSATGSGQRYFLTLPRRRAPASTTSWPTPTS